MRERVMKWLQIKRYNWKNYDIFLIAVVLILTFISSYVISIVNSDISLKRQLVGVVMGIVIIGIFSIIDYHDLCMYIPIIYIVTTLMAMATRLTPLGVELDTGSYRWLDFKVFTFQPSEVCKITLILALATFFSKRKENLSTYKNFFLASLITFVPTVFILIQTDLSSSVVMIVILIMMLASSGIGHKILAPVLIILLFKLKENTGPGCCRCSSGGWCFVLVYFTAKSKTSAWLSVGPHYRMAAPGKRESWRYVPAEQLGSFHCIRKIVWETFGWQHNGAKLYQR